MAAGFVHGVLNSDNINVTGESFDYGPWRFLPVFDPTFTAAYFDQSGLYAFGRQPVTLNWNLARLAECLLPILPAERLQPVLDSFQERYQPQLVAAVCCRLGLENGTVEHVRGLFDFLRASRMPYEQFFYDAYGTGAVPGFDLKLPPRPGVGREHAYFQRGRPCTMLIDEVEAIWAPIAERDDWSAFEAKLADIALMRDAYSPRRQRPKRGRNRVARRQRALIFPPHDPEPTDCKPRLAHPRRYARCRRLRRHAAADRCCRLRGTRGAVAASQALPQQSGDAPSRIWRGRVPVLRLPPAGAGRRHAVRILLAARPGRQPLG
jgi:hypothetical protein